MIKINYPLVCVCIPTYNNAKTIRETLDSIIKQSYQNLVIKVVDNASSDDTLNVVAEIDDSRVKVYRNEINIGAEGNFNRCIQLATGKYTAIFHADDIYEPNIVEEQVTILEAYPEAGAVFTEARLIDETGTLIGEIRFPKYLVKNGFRQDFESIFKALLRCSNFLICPSVMVHTEIYKHEIQYWRSEKFNSSADLDVWLRIGLRHPLLLLPSPLMRYRISAEQFSAKVRLQTGRADFFKVTDFYISKKDVRSLLTSTDFQNYFRLEQRDNVQRAINSFVMGQAGAALDLLGGLYSWDALIAALQGKRGLGVLIAGSYLRFLILFRLENFGALSLMYMKRMLRK